MSLSRYYLGPEFKISEHAFDRSICSTQSIYSLCITCTTQARLEERIETCTKDLAKLRDPQNPDSNVTLRNIVQNDRSVFYCMTITTYNMCFVNTRYISKLGK